jgi:O-antigen ligase
MRRRILWKPKSLLFYYIIAFVIGVAVGLKALPVIVVAILYLLLACLCALKCVQGNVPGFFSLIPFAIYTEVYMRAEEQRVPYLTIQYLFIFCFGVLLLYQLKQKSRHSGAFILLLLFTFLEFTNNLTPDNSALVRTTLTNSMALLMPIIWASYYVLKPILINKLLNSVKIASVYLAGIVFVAHLTGGINYGLYSSSASSNGLAPVQLSGYLGVGCSLLFLSIMNPEEVKQRILNVVVLGFCATIMVLTFSRGGLYFLFAVIGLYLFYNRAKLGQYAKFLILIPIGYAIYAYVVASTGGMIVERYEQEGTSNRDVLVEAGFILFAKNPIIGVGTGNYNTMIIKENLFPQESGPHNEFVRAGAEHGIFGLIFYWGFFIALFITILRRGQPQQQFAMYFFALFCLISVHNGLKIGIQPLLTMLAVGTPSFLFKRKPNAFHQVLPKATIA